MKLTRLGIALSFIAFLFTVVLTSGQTPQCIDDYNAKDCPGAVGVGVIPLGTSFDGTPTAPQNFNTHPEYANYDIQIHQRDQWTVLEGGDPVPAQHAPTCTFNDTTRPTHDILVRQAQSFVCANHLMTTLPAHGNGYNEIIITPTFIIDVSNGPATVSFDVSTSRSSTRDWWDMMISGWNTQTPVYPVEGAPDIQTLNTCRLNDGGTACDPSKHWLNITNGPFGGGPGCPACVPFQAMTELSSLGISSVGYLADSGAVRDHFVLTIDQHQFTFCKTTGTTEPILPLCFFTNAPHTLTDSQLVVQWGHHGYTPDKGTCFQAHCTCPADTRKTTKADQPNEVYSVEEAQADAAIQLIRERQGWGTTKAAPLGADCPVVAGSFHWDNFDVDVAHKVPITIIHCTPDQLKAASVTVQCNAPAPANSYLRFSGFGAMRVGGVLVPPKLQMIHAENVSPYFYPISPGSQNFTINMTTEDNQFGSFWYGGFGVKDISIFSKSGGAPLPTPTSIPATATATVVPPSSTPTPTATIPPTVTPIPATSTPVPTSTASSTPTSVPTATSTPVPTAVTGTCELDWIKQANGQYILIPNGSVREVWWKAPDGTYVFISVSPPLDTYSSTLAGCH